jgi:hypothetical protein
MFSYNFVYANSTTQTFNAQQIVLDLFTQFIPQKQSVAHISREKERLRCVGCRTMLKKYTL